MPRVLAPFATNGNEDNSCRRILHTQLLSHYMIKIHPRRRTSVLWDIVTGPNWTIIYRFSDCLGDLKIVCQSVITEFNKVAFSLCESGNISGAQRFCCLPCTFLFFILDTFFSCNGAQGIWEGNFKVHSLRKEN